MDSEAFFAAIRGSNPFSATRVNSPDESVVTVENIHNKEFRQLCDCCALVQQSGRAMGVVLLGFAGVGKSHLLSRLRNSSWSKEGSVYIYLHNVMASPDNMPRHFLRSIVSQLFSFRTSYKDSSLYGLMKVLMKSLRDSGAISSQQIAISKARDAFLQRAESIGLRDDRINAAVFEVLFRFYADVNMHRQFDEVVAGNIRATIDWISGDGITDETARSIGIPADRCQPDDDGLVRLQDDHDVEQVIMALAGLAQASGKILLVCLDQFDNLSPEQAKSFARFAHALLDHAHSLLLITAGVTQTMLSFRENQVISEAQWDRIAEREISLHLISKQQAEDLIQARLEPIQAQAKSIPTLAELLEKHSYFPIGQAEFEKRFGEAIELRPRGIVKWADEIWRSEQERLLSYGGSHWLETWSSTPVIQRKSHGTLADVIDEAVTRALNESIADLRENSNDLPLDADNLATVVHRLLEYCRVCDANLLADVSRMKNDRPCHIVLKRGASATHKTHSIAIAFITSRDGRVARPTLERLEGFLGVTGRVLITDEENSPLPMTPTIKETYERLMSNRAIEFRHFKLDFQLRVELESLRCVIEDAQNIMVEFPLGSDRSLTPTEVADSVYRQGRLLAHPLLAELLLSEHQLDSSVDEPVQASVSLTTVPSNTIETVIHGNLGWRISISSNDVVREVLEMLPAPQPCFEDVHAAVVSVARQGEEKGSLIVKEHSNGLLLLKS